MVTLSICIPTYSRRNNIVRLVNFILEKLDSVEICIHIDGSKDGTLEALSEIDDPRLKVTFAENAGRAKALASAINNATGKFIMIYDDDDWLLDGTLEMIVEDCQAIQDEKIAGIIYLMENDKKEVIGDSFPLAQSNFMAIRADLKVKGDKKEVVRAELLKNAVAKNRFSARRIPTSLYWSKIAMTHDVLCKNVVVGGKKYLEGGMTAQISKLKKDNAAPMAQLHAARIKGFLKGRYRSINYFLKSILAWFYYSTLSISSKINKK